ncbi:hypothetical protein [Synechococcus phage BUCT-ZZ01]|nr:hypothetical protein [Synechococcus phage BUCT-ZZ01]
MSFLIFLFLFWIIPSLVSIFLGVLAYRYDVADLGHREDLKIFLCVSLIPCISFVTILIVVSSFVYDKFLEGLLDSLLDKFLDLIEKKK